MTRAQRAPDYYGQEVLSLSTSARARVTQEAFLYWRKEGFPFYTFRNDQVSNELRNLQLYDKSRLLRTLRKPSMVGLALANSYHPQIWEARVRGKSALDVFQDDTRFQASLSRAPRMWPHRKCWGAACIRMLVGLQNRSRVANFRPTVARVVAEVLSGPGSRVLDFCAGYGGRYLGIATLDRFYLGIDAARRQIVGLEQMSKDIEALVPSQAQFYHGGAENLLQGLESRSFDLVFTSPPYFRLEKYEDDESQCWRKYSSYHDWRERFLLRVIKESFRVLRPGGILAINLANYGPYPIADDFEILCRQQYKHKLRVWKIYMSTNPRIKKVSGIHKKSEPLFVIKK